MECAVLEEAAQHPVQKDLSDEMAPVQFRVTALEADLVRVRTARAAEVAALKGQLEDSVAAQDSVVEQLVALSDEKQMLLHEVETLRGLSAEQQETERVHADEIERLATAADGYRLSQLRQAELLSHQLAHDRARHRCRVPGRGYSRHVPLQERTVREATVGRRPRDFAFAGPGVAATG